MTREDITFTSGGKTCAAWLYLPDGAARPGAVRRDGAWLRRDARGRDPGLRRALRRRRHGRARLRLPALRRQRGRTAPAARHRPAARGLDGGDRVRAHARGGRRDAHRAVGLVLLGRPRRPHRCARRPRARRDLAGAVRRRVEADRLVLAVAQPEDHAARPARPAPRSARAPAALRAGHRAARVATPSCSRPSPSPATWRSSGRTRAGATSARRA